MYDYIVEELRNLIDLNFPTNQVQSIMGHSMGGHGALVIGLKNPELYKVFLLLHQLLHLAKYLGGKRLLHTT